MDRIYLMRNNIRKYRIELGYSQAYFGKLVGLSQNTISSLENGKYGVSAYNAGIICKVLHKKFEEVFVYEWKEVCVPHEYTQNKCSNL